MTKSIKPKRWKKWTGWLLWFLLFQFILINISAALHAWKFTHLYTDPQLRIQHPSSKNIFVKTWKLFSGMKIPRSLPPPPAKFPVDTVVFTTKNGTRIDCWYGRTDSASKGTVILCHNYTGSKATFAHVAAEFRYMGYNVLIADLRGHGSSSGNVTTLGFKEAEEVKLAFDYIQQQKGEKNIFLWGASMGAVAIAKAVSQYDLKPAAVLLEMPFASLQTHAEARSRVLGFPEEPFGLLVTGWIGIEQGFNGYRFNVANYAKKIKCPVMLSCGTRDRYVLQEETEKIYDNIPGNTKRLVSYEDADHQNLLSFDPVKWRSEVGSFLADPAATRP
jgi:uncharacterized protein